jgi:hypothetical protein
MKLIECLNKLPDDMVMIDLEAIGYKKTTVAELKKKVVIDEDGYEIRSSKRNYGKINKISIGIIGGYNLYNEK